ncbi:MAG: sigma-54 dependent transcriptional regulator [Candidatus Marinimicrobia bacterium]|nr:sigma-54 dependent transcriptional regulator [Candidatus Neomarinimicrobiota bacterium]
MDSINHQSIKGNILVVDDDPNFLNLVSKSVKKENYKVYKASNLKKALNILNKHPEIDIALFDVILPEGLSHNYLDQIISEDNLPVVIMLTASDSVDHAVSAMKSGAFDYLQKPCNFKNLFHSIELAKKQAEANREIIRLRKELTDRYRFDKIIGDHPKMQELFQTIEQLTSSNISVLIKGETGTGKELLAKAIHYNSIRKNGPFVVVNSAAIPDNLIESELFGHEKGSFTGADKQKLGKFEKAHGGTLFFDEIGDMPLKTQAKLLRAFQEKEITRVGGHEKIDVDVRLITATHQNLEEFIEVDKFREDLYYRISVFPITIPPLRERKSDIALLVKHFLKKYEEDVNKQNLEVASDALRVLMNYDWPGNVRELENCIRRAMLLIDENTLKKQHLSDKLLQTEELHNHRSSGQILSIVDQYSDDIPPLQEIESEVLQKALKITNGNVSEAARKLEIGRATFYRKIKKYDIEYE